LVWPEEFTPLSSEKVADSVLKNAGARPWDRDDVDKRIVKQVINKTSRIIDSEQEVGGYPTTNSTTQKFNEADWDLIKMVKE
jgi:hypothetical protein